MNRKRFRTCLVASTVVASVTLPAHSAHSASPVQYPTTKMKEISNKYRKRHGVPGLGVSDELAASAQKWAERGKFEHSPGSYGENLWASGSACTEGSIARAVESWYAEEGKYDYKHPNTVEGDRKEMAKGVGHFTQLVWKGSKRLGVGVASHPGKKWKCLVVAQYSPAGNMLGEFRANVLPPR